MGLGTALENDSQPVIALPDIVAEQQVAGALNGRKKYVFVSIIVEIGKHGGAPISDRINSGDS